MAMKPSHRVPTVRTSGFSRSEVCSGSGQRCHSDFFNMSIPCLPSIHSSKSHRSVRHMAAESSPTRVLPTKLHCCSFDTCFFKARLCAANENNVTRRPGKPFYGRPREDLQFLSRAPLVASIRRWMWIA